MKQTNNKNFAIKCKSQQLQTEKENGRHTVWATTNQTATNYQDSSFENCKCDPVPFNNVYCSYQKSLRIL